MFHVSCSVCGKHGYCYFRDDLGSAQFTFFCTRCGHVEKKFHVGNTLSVVICPFCGKSFRLHSKTPIAL